MSTAPATETLERVEAALAGIAFERREARDGMPTIEVERDRLHEVLKRLKERAGFDSHTLVTGVDRFPDEPRFEVVHQLLSIDHEDRVRVRTRLPSDGARVASARDLWPGAGFPERECYDLFGIEFEGHGDLRRLLMPEAYEHFPLRKDFPHQGIEPDRLYREWDRKRREPQDGRA